MPRVRIQDYFGYNYEIHTSNPALLAAWLVETLAPMVNADASFIGQLRIDIQPNMQFDAKTGKHEPDWVPGNSFIIDRVGMDRIYQILSGHVGPWKSEQFQRDMQ